MSSWYVAPALNKLLDEINARYPNRNKASDGSIGDASHKAKKSDHNPDPPVTGVVRARDFTNWGNVVSDVVNAAVGDPRVAYVISNRRIWQNPAVFKNGGWLPYNGVNAHTQHVHVSIRKGYENSMGSWLNKGAPAVPNQPSKPSSARSATVSLNTQKALQGAKHDTYWGDDTDMRLNLVRAAINNQFPGANGKGGKQGVMDAQWICFALADGVWGKNSKAALKETIKKLQRAWGVKADGIWGNNTEAAWIKARANNFKTW